MPEARKDSSEDLAARYATLASVAMMAQQVAGRAASNTLFLSHFSLDYLPKAMAASALLSALGVFGFARVLTRMGPVRGVPFVFGLSAALFSIEWGLSGAFPRAMALAVYGHTALFGATVASAFWSLVNERFDPHTARKVVSRITRGTTLGTVVGGLVVWRIGRAVDVAGVPLGLGILNLIAMFLTTRVAPRGDGRGDAAVVSRAGEVQSPVAILGAVRRTPYLRMLAALVVLGALVQSLLDYVLNAEAVVALGKGEALLTFFALFYTATGALSFIVQSAITRRALDTFGLAGSISALPGVVAVASFGRLFLPPLWAAIVARGGESTVRSSLYRAGYELLYAPLPQREKRATKAVIDVGFDRLGSALGAGITGLVIMLPASVTARTLTALTVGFSIVMFAVSRALHLGHVKALEQNLRSGVLKLGKDDVLDATTGRTVTEMLDALDRQRVLRGLLAEVESLRTGRVAAPSTAFLPQDEPSLASIRAPSFPSSPGFDETPPPPAARRAVELAGSPVIQAIADVRSFDRVRVTSALARGDVHDALLVPHVVELLADARLGADGLSWLRGRVDRVAGQLVDLMLDAQPSIDVRRQVPRVLGFATTARALDGLLAAQGDQDYDVRFRAAVAAARLIARTPSLQPSRDAVVALFLSEAERLRQERPEDRDVGHRGDFSDPRRRARVELLFTLLSLTMEREPLRLTFFSLMTDDAYLRGTALEYLAAVLSEDVRHVLWSVLGVAEPSLPATRRSERELTEELKSRHSLWSISPSSGPGDEDEEDGAL
jgi:HEAT repeat protein